MIQRHSYIFDHIKIPNYPIFGKHFSYMNIDANYNYFLKE
jgi:hypothetical protein